MNRCHEHLANPWRRKRRLLLHSVSLLATLMLLSALARAQEIGEKTPAGAVCPLSESQTQKSIAAFSKIASTVSSENRCLGCHGRVNPHIDGIGPDKGDPDAPPSEFEHGAGAVDRKADCNECHNHMARRTRDGSESIWQTAPPFLSFMHKDAPTLCKQIRGILHNAKDFLGHVKDDNGGNNFADTAFNGDRGLDRTMYSEKDVPTEKPHITHAALLKLGSDWVASMGGEFQGDETCGCEPVHYAIQYSTSTKVSLAGIDHSSEMAPVDIPIDFKDDGTYTGEGEGAFVAGGSAAGCTEQSTTKVKFRVSGKTTETSKEQAMHVELQYPAPLAMDFSGDCPDEPDGHLSLRQDIPVINAKSAFDMKGEVGEEINRTEDSMPGIVTKMHLEIIKKE
jgi:hypothetical protein